MMNDIDLLKKDYYQKILSYSSFNEGKRIFHNKKEEIKNEAKPLTQEQIKDIIHKDIPELKNIEDILDKIISQSEYLNKKVTLRVNQDINRIIITIINKETNEVIKEIPCKELQELAKELQETIGMLFDEKA